MIRSMKKIVSIIVSFAAVAQLASCTNEDPKKPGFEYMPNMYRSPSYETYSSNPNFADSMTARQPVNGTIARGDMIYNDYDRLPYHLLKEKFCTQISVSTVMVQQEWVMEQLLNSTGQFLLHTIQTF